MSNLPSWLAALIAILIPGYGEPPEIVYNGYAEGNYVYVAPEAPGRIVSIAVEEGQKVFEGQLLFKLDDTDARAVMHAAEARVAQAKANLDNLKTGRRKAEIDVIRASLAQAEADQHLAETTLKRSEKLLQRELVPPAQVDADRARLEAANARVEQLRAQLKVAELPARDAQVLAAEAALNAARAEADRARSALEKRVVLSPATGTVDKVFFDKGEVAGIGAPAVAILPPGAIKLIFFIPEAERPAIALGEELDLNCDGCPEGLTARVTRMASEPQFTPPILYSRDERGRLVFRAEGKVLGASPLLPGQPITLRRR